MFRLLSGSILFMNVSYVALLMCFRADITILVSAKNMCDYILQD